MYVTDYHDRQVEFAGTANEAMLQGLNVDCWNCRDCRGCYRCQNCLECSGCCDCHDCVDCTKCMSCHHCQRCLSCRRCHRLDGYYDCRQCHQPPIVIQTEAWPIHIRTCRDLIRIGCLDHPYHEWLEIVETQLDELDLHARSFYHRWHEVIRSIVHNQPTIVNSRT